MPKQIVVAIDGMSACGKTTLAKELAEEYGFVYIHSDLADAKAGWAHIMSQERPVIMDRWWASTPIYAYRRWTRADIQILSAAAQAPYSVKAYVIVHPEDSPEAREVHAATLAVKATTGILAIGAQGHTDIFQEELRRWTSTNWPGHVQRIRADHKADDWLEPARVILGKEMARYA